MACLAALRDGGAAARLGHPGGRRDGRRGAASAGPTRSSTPRPGAPSSASCPQPVGDVLVLTAGTSDGAGRRRGRRDAGRPAASAAAGWTTSGWPACTACSPSRPTSPTADAVVVVAGMDGALPSVVAGLTDRLVVAVPTSVGYGAAFEGLAALLTMLTACAPGRAGGQHRQRVRRGRAPPAARSSTIGSAVADGVGQQLVHRAGPEPARVDLDPVEAGHGREQLGAARPGRPPAPRRPPPGRCRRPGRAPAGRAPAARPRPAPRAARPRPARPGPGPRPIPARRRRSGWPGRRRPACRPAAGPTAGRPRGRRPWSSRRGPAAPTPRARRRPGCRAGSRPAGRRRWCR